MRDQSKATPPLACADCQLRRQPAFIAKTANELEWTQKIKRGVHHVPAGGSLVRANDTQTVLYTLYSGWAFRHRMLADGRRQILNFFMPGDLIGLQGSMLTGADHNVDALSDLELCILPRAQIWRLFRDMPELAFQVTWLGAREEGIVDDNLTAVGQMSASERMSAMLIGLYRRAERLNLVEDNAFDFPVRREHLADSLGLSLVHTIKTWSALRKAGLFQQIDGKLRILNPRLTNRLASLYEREWNPRPII